MKQGIKGKDIWDFVKACNKLNDIINRINEYKPDARYYLGDSSMYLISVMNDDHKVMQDNIVANVWMPKADGGGW